MIQVFTYAVLLAGLEKAWMLSSYKEHLFFFICRILSTAQEKDPCLKLSVNTACFLKKNMYLPLRSLRIQIFVLPFFELCGLGNLAL